MTSLNEFSTFLDYTNGSSIPERRRQYNYFMKQLDIASVNLEQLSNSISSTVTNDITKEMFRIEIMFQFKLYNTLINELKSNNSILIRKLLKNWKVFGDIISSISPQVFVNDILPYLSYSSKLKLLNGIYKNVKDENLVDQYLFAIEAKYGRRFAMALLPGCTIKVIKLKLDRHPIKLSNRQLIHIIKKDKDFLEYYLDLWKTKNPEISLSHEYRKAIRVFAKIHADRYWKLNDKYDLYLTFGKRMTPKMFRIRNVVYEQPFKFLNALNLKQLYKTAIRDGEFENFLLTMYPETHQKFEEPYEVYHIYFILVRVVPRAQRYVLYSSLFKTKYGDELTNYPQYIGEHIIAMMPVEKRKNILDVMVKDNPRLVYLYECRQAFPLIKEQIRNCSSFNRRTDLVYLMYIACTVNNDEKALLDLLQYLLTVHRNNMDVLGRVLNGILSWPALEKLNEVYWSHIMDIALILESSPTSVYDKKDVYTKYIFHAIEYNKECERECKILVHEIADRCSSSPVEIHAGRKRKRFAQKIGKYIQTCKNHDDYQSLCLTFLEYIIQHNSQSITDQICLNHYNFLFDQIKLTDCYQSRNIIIYCLKNYKDEIWHKLFWKYTRQIRTNTLLSWYVQQWPEKVYENLNKIFEDLQLTHLKTLIKQVKKYMKREEHEQIKMYALSSLHSDDYNTIKIATIILSIIAPEILLESITSQSTNTSKQFDQSKNKFMLKKLMMKQLHLLGNPSEIFAIIAEHCIGKYSRHVLSALSRIAYNTPELLIREELMKFVNGTSVNATKNVLILARQLLRAEDFAKILQAFNMHETNISIGNIVICVIFKYFQDNPSELVWNFFKENITLMNKNSKEIYESFMRCDMIPQKYLPEYIPLIFKQISDSSFMEIRNKKFKFLDNIPTTVIENLDYEFLKDVIVRTFLNNDNDFHWKCVFYTKGIKQEKLLEENFKLLKDYVQTSKDQKETIIVNRFIGKFLDISLDINKNLIQGFIAAWHGILKLDIFCKAYIMLLFTEIYFKSDFDAYSTGIRIKQLIRGYIQTIGPSVVPLVSMQLETFLNKSFLKNDNEDTVKFLDGMMVDEYDENIYLIIISTIALVFRKQNNKKEYIPLLKIISEYKSPLVRFYFDSLLEDCIANYL